MNLAEAHIREIIRVARVAERYDGLPDGAGEPALKLFIEPALERAVESHATGDVVKMLASHSELKEIEPDGG